MKCCSTLVFEIWALQTPTPSSSSTATSCAYYIEGEFWDTYDEKKYIELRRRYHAEILPSVYDKVKVDLQGVAGGKRGKGGKSVEDWKEWAYNRFWETWPLGGLYGVASATKGLGP
jgi:delta24-sterol reductase